MAAAECDGRLWQPALLPRPHRCFLRRAHKQTEQKMCQQPVIELTKKEVLERNLKNYAIRDDGTLTFELWWKTLEDDDTVEVQYPHQRHGLSGKTSNHAKEEVMECLWIATHSPMEDRPIAIVRSPFSCRSSPG